MVTVALILLQVLSLSSVSADQVSFSVSAHQEAGAFHSLDEAFNQTAQLEDVELVLLPAIQPYSVSVPVVLSRYLRVRGQGQTMQLEKLCV